MLSLVELERVVDVLRADWLDARVERWVQPSPDELCVTLYRRDDEGRGGKRHLSISAAPELARISERDRPPPAPANPPAFSSYLRAHLARARLVAARLRGEDRQLELVFEAKEGRFVLLLSIFGRRSNVYLLDADDRLLLALRPLGETRAELARGERYRDPDAGPPRRGEDRFADVPDEDLLAEIEARYAEQASEQEASDLGRRLERILKKELKATQRRLDRIEAELAEAEQATMLQRQGELLKSALGRLSGGEREVTVEDWETGESVTIPLDPKLAPKANLEATFKRYQKLLRRLTKAGGQVDEARAELAALQALEDERADLVARGGEAGSQAALEALAARDEVKRLLLRHEVRAPSAAPVVETPRLPAAYRNLPRKLHPRRYVSAEGLEIWVGRSDAANDVLTTRIARGNDLFFHLDGAPGSHVILRTEGRTDPPSEAVIDACELAVHFSKAKKAGSADVHVVPIKNVKKPKGAKPGLVYVTGGKSIHLRREPERLKRLLESRIDE